MKRRMLPLLFLAAGLPAFGAPLRVVASFSILGDWARIVGGDDAVLTVMVGPDGDAHAYEPSPADGRAVAGADVLLDVGRGFEPWLDKIVLASGAAPRRVHVTDGMALRRNGKEVDPHVWGDPENAVRAVEALRDAFSAADPGRADAYRRRAAAYAAELKALDGWIKSQTAPLPPGRRVLVTSHDTLGYWADRYGFRVEASLLDSFSTEAADPSAARMARLADRVRELGVPAIFVENIRNGGLAETLARTAGVRLTPRLYTDALGAPGSPGATYLDMMKYNTRTIVAALAATSKP